MGSQEVLLVLLFVAALGYLVRIIYNNLKATKGCSNGCGKCGVDFSDIKPKID